jgi:hypothetical protein
MDNKKPDSRRDFEYAVATALRELHLEPEAEPITSGTSPDIVVRLGDTVLIIETKFGDPSATIPSVSLPQAIDYLEAAKSKYQSKKVSTIVITNQKVPAKMKEIFSANGVAIGSISRFDVGEIKKVISDSVKQTRTET